MQFIPAVVLALTVYFYEIPAQSIGPVPPRLNIPGAIPVQSRPLLRGEKINSVPLIRIRRPILRQNPLNVIPAPRQQEQQKPVTEETEENFRETFITNSIQHNPTSPSPTPQSQQSFHEHQSGQQDISGEDTEITIPRLQQQTQQQQRLPELQSSGQRFNINQQDRPKPRVRPINRDSKPHFAQEIQLKPSHSRLQISKPVQFPNNNNNNNNIHHEERERKPVAQILRKYREEHEDGSITWGFENDDGSFKEETIGIDCITRGRYGYIDPDGLNRVYNYETGILCDPNKRSQEEIVERTGFIDYEGKKAILPNGVEIDLATMGKKKSKRPGAILQQQKQFYSN